MTTAQSRCVMHNMDVEIPPAWLIGLPIGNTIGLCDPCYQQWLTDAADRGDEFMKPVWVRSVGLATRA